MKSRSIFSAARQLSTYSHTRAAKYNRDKMQDAFFGSFAANKPHGEVLAHYCDGSKHQGTFRDGTRHGKGTTEEENGNRVIGTWALDKRDGVFEVGESWPGYGRGLSGSGLVRGGSDGAGLDWVGLDFGWRCWWVSFAHVRATSYECMAT